MEQVLRGANFMRLCVEEENKNSEVPEAEVVRQAQEGNAAAFEQLYRRHSGRVYCLCLRMLKNVSEAEDLTQEAFLQLFRKIHTFRGEAKFSTWFYRMAFNLVLMRFRKTRHAEASLDAAMETNEDDAVPLAEFGGPDLRLSGAIDRINLHRAIEKLAHGYKQMFILHDVEGFEHHEIARILGCTVGNSKSQVYKARCRLRELLRKVSRSHAREQRKSSRSLRLSERKDVRLEFAKM
jgi:RNA polymerase sigma-70 factor (ECF subfamily)